MVLDSLKKIKGTIDIRVLCERRAKGLLQKTLVGAFVHRSLFVVFLECAKGGIHLSYLIARL